MQITAYSGVVRIRLITFNFSTQKNQLGYKLQFLRRKQMNVRSQTFDSYNLRSDKRSGTVTVVK